MTRSTRVLALISIGIASVALPASSAAQYLNAPNVVLIIADDLGYGELGCYGGTDYPTPNIDSLARNGIRMTDGYCASPTCGPSRAGMLTGKYPHRFGYEFNEPRDPAVAINCNMPLDQRMLSERFKLAGYTTGLVGKWHLGQGQGHRPWERGYDYFYGILSGGSMYMQTKGVPVVNNGVNEKTYNYLTDELTSRAVSFIDANFGRRFFLCLSYTAPHLPYQAPTEYLSRFPNLTNERRTTAAMMAAVDDGVGLVQKALRRYGLERNTMVYFVGDNGGVKIDGVARTGIFRGEKRLALEGGVRVPYIVSYPFKLPKGQVYTNPVSLMDVTPTAMAAIGLPIPSTEKLDGKNLIPFWQGTKTGLPHETLYWRLGTQTTGMRHLNYKIASWTRISDGAIQRNFSDLSTDPGETIDLRSSQPELHKQLRNKWNFWSSKMAEPLWTR